MKKLGIHSIVVLALVFAGCGGGTIGTGINSLGRNSTASSDLSFELVATVKSSSGTALPGSSITIFSRKGIVYRKANHQGVATLPLVIESGEELRFVIESSGKRYEVADYLSPAGEASIKRTLRLQPSGAIEIGE